MKQFVGEIEVNESYFGPNRARGQSTKRGRGTDKKPVFGIYERNGRVYTKIIHDCKKRTLHAIMRHKID